MIAFGTLVPKLSLSQFLSSSAVSQQQQLSLKSPFIINDIVSPTEIEHLTEQLIQDSGKQVIQMQRKRVRASTTTQQGEKTKTSQSSTTTATTKTTEIYDVTLDEAIEYCMYDSYHNDSYLVFCEELLSSSSSPIVSDIQTNILSKPFAGKENWFHYFPKHYQPNDALIISGTGCTSTLHRDPFEWTGLNICMEGTKIWRFIVPNDSNAVNSIHDALKSYRLNSIAWGDGENDNNSDNNNNNHVPTKTISSGWQSDYTLFESTDTKRFPDAYGWNKILEEENGEETYEQFMKKLSTDMSCLRPNIDVMDALNQLSLSTTESSSSSSSFKLMTAIQHTGELLIIPAHCWHMTYAPVPSISIASQRCGYNDGHNVIHHILEQTQQRSSSSTTDGTSSIFDFDNIPTTLTSKQYNEGDGKAVVKELFQFLQI